MKLHMKKYSLYNYCLIGLLVFVASIFFIRCYYHEMTGDELTYQYLWEDDDPTGLWDINHKFINKADNLKDIIHFQIRHYQEVGGRSLVHTIEQLFTDRLLYFSVINTCIFILFISLIKFFVTNGKKGNYLLWLSIICSLLFLFPYQESLWTSVNYGLNYLWPATAAVGVIWVWQKMESRAISSKYMPLIVLLAIFSGWSHEAFSIGVAGGMFLYYCCHLKKFKGQVLWLVLPYWISTAVMVFAPGNFKRLNDPIDGAPVTLIARLFNGVDNVMHLFMFWIFWFFVVILFIKQRRQLISFIKSNVQLLLVSVCSMTFSLFINNVSYSHTFCVLLSMLIIFRYLCDNPIRINSTIRYYSLITLTILFVSQQIILAYDTIKVYHFQHGLMESYKQSKDGIIVLNSPNISLSSKFYIRGGDERMWYGYAYRNPIQGVYGKWKKGLYVLKPEDFIAVSNPSAYFIKENRIDGNSCVYKSKGSRYAWVNPKEYNSLDKFEAILNSIDFRTEGNLYTKLLYLRHPIDNPAPVKLLVDTIKTDYGNAYRIKLPTFAKTKKVMKVY